MWRNSAQVKRDLSERYGFVDNDERLERFFLFGILLNGSVIKSNFDHTDAIFEHVAVSPYFEETISDLLPALAGADDRVKKAVALQVTFLHEPLVSFADTNDVEILDHFSKAIRDKRILLPDRFGLTLYKKFNEEFSDFARDRVSHLSHDASLRLLDGSQQGVYQVGRLVLGPVGIIQSSDKRMIPVGRNIPLWHCEDTGCNHLHNVELRSYAHQFLNFASQLKSEFVAKHGRPSEWQRPFYINAAPDRSPIHGHPFYDLPVLLAEAFNVDEMNRLFERALLSRDRSDFKRSLSGAGVDRNWLDGSPETVLDNTESNEAVQLLSSLNSRRVVELIDCSIDDGRLFVPLNEVRKVNLSPPKIGSADPRTVVSALGVRSDRSNPVTYMAEAIWRAYDGLGLLEDLEWRCRKASGSASLSTPIDFIRLNDPADVARELVLCSREVTMKVAEQLSLGSPNFDDGPRLIEKMLWKFGFTRPRYDDRLHRMEGQIAAFKDELLRASDPMREEDRERIREKGVNLFVNLEYFIEELVAYNAWLFGSDHFLGTKFVYDRINALEVVAETVGDMIEAGDHQLVWKRQGGNTLGVLLAYATAVSDKVKELPTASRETLGRPTDELPHYDDKARFVFRHREAWADFSEIETKAYSDQLSKLVSLLSRGRIDFVRNGLDHFREEGKFPEIEVLTNFATFVEQALQSAVVHRLYPVALWLRLASEDEMGRQQFELTDYRGREVRIFRPGLVLGLRSVRFGVPYVIPGVNLIGHANSELCFEIREQSGFSQMWKDYPIRQSWASKTLDVPEAGSA